MVTVISSFAKTELRGEGLSVNRRSNSAASSHHDVRLYRSTLQRPLLIQFITILKLFLCKTISECNLFFFNYLNPFISLFPEVRQHDTWTCSRSVEMASLSICIALHYITPFCQSLLSKPGNSTTKNLNSFIYSPYIHLTFSILIVGHSANFTLQNECSRRYINPPWVISTRYWIIKEGLICQDVYVDVRNLDQIK